MHESLEKAFNSEVEKLLIEVKEKSSTYEEAKELLKKMEWNRIPRLKQIVISEASDRLNEEMNSFSFRT
jgi:hypothetical protein